MSKFCVNCGAQLDDNAGFCGACGSKQEAPQAAAPAPQETPAPQATPATAPANDSSPIGAMGDKISSMSPEQKKKIGIIAAIVAAVVVIGVVVGVVVNELTKYQKIDCEELYYVNYSGINGQATAEVFLASADNIEKYCDVYDEFRQSDYYEDYDYEGFYNSKCSKWLSTDKKTMKKAWTKFDSTTAMAKAQKAVLDNVEFKIDEEELKDLSNGDTITVKVKYSESKLKKKNIKLENTEFTITVEGLVEPEVLKPLENLKVEFSGVDGKGEVTSNTDGISDMIKDMFYITSAEYYYNLSNGDTVKYTASPYYSLSDGYFVYEDKYYTYNESDLTREFKVDGLTGLTVVDPFEGFELNYTGVAPDLRVSANTDNCSQAVKDCISFDISKTSQLGIGDTITVTASVSWYYEDDFIGYGYKLASDEVTKDFTVEATAPHYINDIAEATTIDNDTLFDVLVEDINNAVGGSSMLGNYGIIDWGDQIASVDKITFEELYLVAPTDIANSSNTLYQLVKIETSCVEDGASTKKTIYGIFYIDGAYVEDGSLGYSGTWYHTSASLDKTELLTKYVLNDSNQVEGKTITTTRDGGLPNVA